MELKRAIIPFEKKAIGEKGSFEGYGSTFGNIDFGGDIVVKGAFSNTLRQWNEKGQLPLMPWFHDMTTVIGDWKEMREDENGLFVCGNLWVEESNKIDASQMVYNLLTGTGPKAMSIGYSVKESEIEEVETENGIQRVKRLLEVDLFELSVVPFGMNPKALVTGAKNLFKDGDKIKSVREVEAILRDGGLSHKQAKAFISGGYSAIARDEQEQKGNDDLAQMMDQLTETMNNFSNTILKGK